MSSICTYLLEILSILQPSAAVVFGFLDVPSIFSTLIATGITAFVLYFVFYVPRLSISFEIAKSGDAISNIQLIVKNNNKFVSFYPDDVYMHFWIPKSLFNMDTAHFELMPHPNNPTLFIERRTKDYRLRSIQPFPMFPQTETATIEIKGDFNLTPNLEHKVYYYFSTKHGYSPSMSLKTLNKKLKTLDLPTESITFK